MRVAKCETATLVGRVSVVGRPQDRSVSGLKLSAQIRAPEQKPDKKTVPGDKTGEQSSTDIGA